MLVEVDAVELCCRGCFPQSATKALAMLLPEDLRPDQSLKTEIHDCLVSI